MQWGAIMLENINVVVNGKNTTIKKGIRYMFPYGVSTFVVWFIVLVGWYIAGIPLGIGGTTTIPFNLK